MPRPVDRIPIGPIPTSDRIPREEKIALRWPWLVPRSMAAIRRLPLGSRIRRASIERSVTQSYAAINRRNLAVPLTGYATDVTIEYHAEYAFTIPDLPRVLQGHDGLRRIWDTWLETMPDITLVPTEVLDFDGGMLVCERARGTGAVSGITLETDQYELFKITKGLIRRELIFTDLAPAMEMLEAL